VDTKKCTCCGLIKDLSNFYKCSKGFLKRKAICKECNKKEFGAADRERANKWRKDNLSRSSERTRRWKAENPDKVSVINRRRDARQSLLPDTLTQAEWEDTLRYFNWSCAICANPNGVQMDHWIPISSGVGGTYKENLIPLCANHNVTKNAKNPNVWCVSLYGYKHRVNQIYDYLAELNGLSVEDYRDYIDVCC
jgi:5-methylcytosine-specific restriction endonuclease McrA